MEFIRLANRTRDITHSLLKSCFIRGLKTELRHDVKILKPQDVLEANAYAQQLDAKLSDLKVKPFSRSFVSNPVKNPLNAINITPPAEIRPKNDNIRKMTSEEVEFGRKNGLCFHCKEKYYRGHSCEKK